MRRGVTMILPGETEAGSAGMQPCRGIPWRAHRDDDRKRGNQLLALRFPIIGSKDPDALKIPARRAEFTLTENASSPFHAEPAQSMPRRTSQQLFLFPCYEKYDAANECYRACDGRQRYVVCLFAGSMNRSNVDDFFSSRIRKSSPRKAEQTNHNKDNSNRFVHSGLPRRR